MTQGAKPVLAVDVDEVLYPFMKLFIEHYNQSYGTDRTLEQFNSYVIEENFPMSSDEKLERISSFVANGGFRNGLPLSKSKAAIEELAKSYDLVVVTSRWKDWEQDTFDWLDRHYPKTFNNVHFANSITWSRGDKHDKASICKELGAVAFIDDSVDNVEKVAETGIKSLLFGDYPWNRTDQLPENVRRVSNWDEVLEVLL